MSSGWGRVVLGIMMVPLLALAAYGYLSASGDQDMRLVAGDISKILLYYGEEFSYTVIGGVALVLTYLLTRWKRDLWWQRNGEGLLSEEYKERIKVLRRERNSLKYRVQVRTDELRVEQARNRATFEALEQAIMACGRAQIALRTLPEKEIDDTDNTILPIRRIN